MWSKSMVFVSALAALSICAAARPETARAESVWTFTDQLNAAIQRDCPVRQTADQVKPGEAQQCVENAYERLHSQFVQDNYQCRGANHGNDMGYVNCMTAKGYKLESQ
jgi:hypothetical protein